MTETLSIEPADVYEEPLLAAVGDFAELTRGALDGEADDGWTLGG
ncbi:lasso RiPP family leader peptide-containing protein [Streptomyces triculaminicus]